jgi:hypothetical protein
MNDLQAWHEHNERYLEVALKWLRLQLGRLADIKQPVLIPVLAAENSFSERQYYADPNDIPSQLGLLSVASERVTEARAAMDAAASAEMIPALLILAQRFGLSPFEQEILLLCAGIELDPTLAEQCARAQGDLRRPYPTFALALKLFDDPAWDSLSPERPLRYWRMLEINQPANEPLTTSGLRLDERILNFIKGLNYLDDRLTPLLTPMQPSGDSLALPASQEQAARAIIQHLKLAYGPQRPLLIQLIGPDSESKQLVAMRAAAELNLNIFRLPAGRLPPHAPELESLARLWERESQLTPLVLYLDANELDPGATEQAGVLGRFLARSHGLFWLDTPQVRTDLGRNMLVVNVARPTAVEQRQAWATSLGKEVFDPSPTKLSGQFNLNLSTIQQVAQTALSQAAGSHQELDSEVWDICLARTSPQLGGLAQHLESKATWDDIVLPEREFHLLRQIAGQVGQRGRVYDEWGFREKMNRGFGINALFAGESGTGKTMAAEVIANDLGLHLYRIDLSSVVSKYIGETEKNLRRLFDAADDGGAILFFDEADALFGKRSEVKDSHDRYANIEINYLLQRMEAYRGLAVLATNMKSALDQAFLRRLRFILNFPFPGLPERRAIWAGVFPSATPTSGLNYDWLARLNLTGGSIHNVAINAAFTAAQIGEAVTMEIVLDAARAEFRKLERPYNEADLRWFAPVLSMVS